jgi:hypothetical protein
LRFLSKEHGEKNDYIKPRRSLSPTRFSNLLTFEVLLEENGNKIIIPNLEGLLNKLKTKRLYKILKKSLIQ